MTLTMIDFKECTGCKRLLSLDFYSTRKNKSGQKVLIARCSDCRTAQNREWRRNNPEKVKAIRKKQKLKAQASSRIRMKEKSLTEFEEKERILLSKTRRCSKCGEIKDKTSFWKNKINWHGLQSQCIDCLRPAHRRWVRDHKEQQNLLTKRWYEQNREKHLENSRLWAAENRDKKNQHRRTRRAAEFDSPGTATPEQVQARMAYYGSKCVYCGGPFEVVEHAFPLSTGGSNWPANLVPSCRSCNARKHVLNIWEFFNLLGATDDFA